MDKLTQLYKFMLVKVKLYQKYLARWLHQATFKIVFVTPFVSLLAKPTFEKVLHIPRNIRERTFHLTNKAFSHAGFTKRYKNIHSAHVEQR